MATNLQAGLPAVLDETSPQIGLGTEFELPDGRKFRYARAGAAALVVGNVVQAAAEVTGNQNLAFAAAVLGATSVVTTTTVTVTANQYAGGYVTVTVTPDLGATYRIKSHAAATGATVTLVLEEGIRTAWTTATRADLVPNPFGAVIICATTPTSAPVGVAVNDLAINGYGWIQTYGPCNVLADAAGVTVGNQVSCSNATAGAVEAYVSGQQVIGRALTGITASQNGLIYLEI